MLDVGCGWGRFAISLLQLGPADLRMAELDISLGMVRTCSETLGASAIEAALIVADARRLPFVAESFDLVMANHMLYEFTDVDAPIVELARVLRSGGELLATTYCDRDRIPLIEFHRLALSALRITRPPEARSTFSLENGEAALRRWFSSVEVHVLQDSYFISDSGAIVASYLKTGRYNEIVTDNSIEPERRSHLADQFEQIAEETIQKEGGIVSQTNWVAFISRRKHPYRQRQIAP